MKFIGNNEKFGLVYDLNKIRKEFNNLKIPFEYNFIDFNRFIDNKYIIDLSERSIGKTNSYLLLGMTFNKLYGTIIGYIRSSKNEIGSKKCREMFNVIESFNNGQYLKSLTNEKYNGVYEHWGSFYYCLKDENGNIVEKSEKPFLITFSCDKHEEYKSTFNNPLCDFIIYDEFISRYQAYETPINFFDLLITIIRSRKSPFVVMLANTLNVNNIWFEELTISREVRGLTKGQTRNIITSDGTKISVRKLRNEKIEEKQEHNRLFFGFKNPKLSAITGSSEWVTANYQHLPKKPNLTLIGKPIFIKCTPFDYLRVEFCMFEERKIIKVSKATRILDNDILLSLTNQDRKYYYGLGSKKFKNLILNNILKNNIYYSSNEVGQDFIDYVNSCRHLEERFF